MMYADIDSVLDKLKKSYPDKMLLDNFSEFERGKLAGHIEVILEIEQMLKQDDEELEDE